MKKNKEKIASLLYLFSTLFNKGIAFLTVPIYTRLLSTGDYGITTTYTSWVDIFTVVFSLALYMAIRTAFIDFKNEKKSFLNTVITFTLLISTIIGVFSIIIGKFILKNNVILIIFAVIQGTASALIMDYQQYLMMDFKYIQRSCYLAIPNFLSALLSILALLYIPFKEKYFGRIIPLVIVHLAFAIIIMLKTYKEQKPSINKNYLKYGLSISLPLVLHGIALNILSQSDRTMITLLDSASSTGIYSLVYNFGMIATVITTALEGIWLPWFMKELENRNITKINKTASDYINLITYIMIALIFVGPEILKILASKEYWEGIKIIPPIVLANYFIFIYSIHVNVEHYYKKTKIITINTIIAAIFNIILNFIFIPQYGYVAASYTTVVSYGIALFLHARYTYKLEKNIFPIRDIIIPLIQVIICTILYYVFMNNMLVRWLAMIVTVVVAIIINLKKIKKYLKN